VACAGIESDCTGKSHPIRFQHPQGCEVVFCYHASELNMNWFLGDVVLLSNEEFKEDDALTAGRIAQQVEYRFGPWKLPNPGVLALRR
jgi:hypothetical protein